MQHDKICAVCSEPFTTNWSTQKYCTPKCAKSVNYDSTKKRRALEHEKRLIECEQCKTKFVPYRGRRDHKFCSYECYIKSPQRKDVRRRYEQLKQDIRRSDKLRKEANTKRLITKFR